LSLHFQSLCSGSSGNSLLVRTETTTILIDAGFNSMRKCRNALGNFLHEIDAVIISHLHTDHIHYSSLRVLQDCGIPVYVYEKEIPLLARWHFRRLPFLDLKIRPFKERPLSIGDFSITPFGVPHDQFRNTFGFEISVPRKGRAKKIVAATDFWDWRHLAGWFTDADFIYVEANHDPELLRAHPNPRSHYHLSNESCGELLKRAFIGGRTRPKTVMLGHLSEIRNSPKLAREKVLERLETVWNMENFALHVAPRYEPSPPIRI
jgi:phosphoribosyl 1,2-cyclic phosphodiesterase